MGSSLLVVEVLSYSTLLRYLVVTWAAEEDPGLLLQVLCKAYFPDPLLS